MKIIRSVKQMQKTARELVGGGKTIGLVPTMGFLHEGHLSLIRRLNKETDIVVTSIFVNPAQFAPGEDLKKYPRDEKGDVKKIKSAGGDIVFMPRAGEIYPDDFQTYVNVEKLSEVLEGKSRPMHFKGVTTIVAKLFNIIRPDTVIFGMKDYQQAMVLKQMTRDLGYPVKFIIAPTVREKDGLAMSSRNKYFSAEQRPEAVCLNRALKKAKAMAQAGVKDCRKMEQEMRVIIKQVCKTAEVDYIAFTDLKSLEAVNKPVKNTICSLAVRVYGVRLIDNMKIL